MSTLLSNEIAILQLLQYISEMERFKDNREDFNLTQKETERWRKSRERVKRKEREHKNIPWKPPFTGTRALKQSHCRD